MPFSPAPSLAAGNERKNCTVHLALSFVSLTFTPDGTETDVSTCAARSCRFLRPATSNRMIKQQFRQQSAGGFTRKRKFKIQAQFCPRSSNHHESSTMEAYLTMSARTGPVTDMCTSCHGSRTPITDSVFV